MTDLNKVRGPNAIGIFLLVNELSKEARCSIKTAEISLAKAINNSKTRSQEENISYEEVKTTYFDALKIAEMD